MTMRSMTGYGQASVSHDGASIMVEIRAVNNRFLDVSVRAQPGLMRYEQETRDLISAQITRGKIDVFVSAPPSLTGKSKLSVDEPLLADFVATLRRLAQKHGLTGDVTVDMLSDFRPGFSVETEPDESAESWAPIKDCINQALEQLMEMRRREGESLHSKIVEQLEALRQDVRTLETTVTAAEQRTRSKVLDFVRKECEVPELDSDRLEQEVAILLVKSDVSEELARMWSHLDQFSSLCTQEPAVGKQLTFICQEMLREVNTIAAKTQSKEAVSKTIEMKSRIEIIREQLNNIE